MVTIPFSRWAPDQSSYAGDVSHDVDGILPGPNCKYPWPGLVVRTSGVGAAVYGAFSCRYNQQDHSFVGTNDKLFKLNAATQLWEDVSNASGTYNAGVNAPWRFALYEGAVIAVHANDGAQTFTLGSSSTFADLANAPSGATLVGVIGNHLALAGQGTGGVRLQGSDIGDATVWSPLATNNAWLQDFVDGGRITGFSTSTSPIIVQERVIRRGTLVGGQTKIRFDRVATDMGCEFEDSVIRYGGHLFFYGTDGFVAVSSSGQIEPIGQGHIDEWMRDSKTFNESEPIIGAPDVRRGRVYWAMCLNSTGTPDTILCFDIAQREWTKLTQDVSNFFQLPTEDLVLDSIDEPIDDLDYSFDDPTTGFNLAIIDTSHRAATFTGDPVAARLYTHEFPKSGGRRTRLQGALPIVDTNAAVITVEKREKRGDAFTDGSVDVAVNKSGWCPLRDTGRFHRLKMEIPAGTTWTKAEGVEVYTTEEGGH